MSVCSLPRQGTLCLDARRWTPSCDSSASAIILTDDFPFLNLVAPLADGPVLPEDRAAVELLLSLTSAEQGRSYHLPQRVPR